MVSLNVLAVLHLCWILSYRARFVHSVHIPNRLIDSSANDSNHSVTDKPIMKRALDDEEEARLTQLSDSYKGIYWRQAYPGASNGDGACSLAQFNILAEATRMSIVFADYSGPALFREDAYSHKFFVRNSQAPINGRWSSADNVAAWGHMQHNLLQPSRFPLTGKGSRSRRVRLSYRCNDPVPIPPGTVGCAGGVPAYTIDRYYTQTGWTTVFCPSFFQRGRYLNDIAAGPAKTISDFGDPSLISYEQMMVHEWMHADVMGYDHHIEDVKDSIEPNGPEYGLGMEVYETSRLQNQPKNSMERYGPIAPTLKPVSEVQDGWVKHFMMDTEGKLTLIQIIADNYAWYFANKYYARLWSWTDDGSAYSLNDKTTGTIGPPDENLVNATSLPDPTWPTNCGLKPSPDATSVFITCSVDSPVPTILPAQTVTGSSSFPTSNLPKPPNLASPTHCDCNEDGCTRDSPPCCANGTC